jgi:hypothetical protein
VANGAGAGIADLPIVTVRIRDDREQPELREHLSVIV